jgi:hypothetical protein
MLVASSGGRGGTGGVGPAQAAHLDLAQAHEQNAA